MKSVLISIRPKWVERIVRSEKTIEERKTAPKEVPFKAYIYCTYGNPKENYTLGKRGKIIGEFICDKVYFIKKQGGRFSVSDEEQSVTNEIARQSCLDYDDMVSYLGDKDGYGWHISDLKIYDMPKELSEYWGRINCLSAHTIECWNCFAKCVERNGKHYQPLKRPPQSWQYVEEIK